MSIDTSRKAKYGNLAKLKAFSKMVALIALSFLRKSPRGIQDVGYDCKSCHQRRVKGKQGIFNCQVRPRSSDTAACKGQILRGNGGHKSHKLLGALDRVRTIHRVEARGVVGARQLRSSEQNPAQTSRGQQHSKPAAEAAEAADRQHLCKGCDEVL